jgi:hypothetical protein
MRREERCIWNGVLLFAGGTIIFDVIRQWWEKQQQEIRLTWENYNGQQTLKLAFRNGIIGGGVGYAYYSYRINEESKLPFDSDDYLRKILLSERLKNDSVFLNKAITYKKTVKEKLFRIFNDALVFYPLDGGSFAKRTAIVSNYDLDIVLAFVKDSYPSLEEMYYDVYKKLCKALGQQALIQKQSKAISVSFELKSGDFIDFDIVPGKEINNFQKDKNLNLYIRPDWIWQRGSSFKTNYSQQRNITTNKPDARNVIKLLKIYRERNNLSIKTVVVEQCVVDALSENNFGIHPSLTENLLNAMDFMCKKLEQKFLIDFTNSNNNLNNKLSRSDRCNISELLQKDIERVERDPRYFQEIFGQ